VKNPREEHYWDMLMSTFCPTFNCISVTIFLILADTALFIAELAIGLNKNGSLLEVETNTIRHLGGNFGPDVANGQIYRLVSAIFLHVNFIHVVGNMFSTFILVTRVEYTFGPLKTLIVYLLCGIGGNIFSLAVSGDSDYWQQVKAGASTALYGMIGLLVGYLVLNWRGLDQVGQQMKCNIVCGTIFMLVFVLIFTPSDVGASIDYFGHLGGFLTGLWTPAILEPLYNGTR
jgi:rhomboid protease GluP